MDLLEVKKALEAVKEKRFGFFEVDIFEVIKAHRGHFFDKDSMRFFSSRLAKTAFRVGDMAYFITSEQFLGNGTTTKDGIRAYTVREFDFTNGSITAREITPFNVCTRSEALTALKSAIKQAVEHEETICNSVVVQKEIESKSALKQLMG